MSAIRYSFGGDEHVFAEIGEEMSLEAFFKGMAICTELREAPHRRGVGDLSVERLLPGAVRSRRRSIPTRC